MNSLKLEKPENDVAMSLMATERAYGPREAKAELAAERRTNSLLKGPTEKKFADWAFEPGVGL